MKIKFLGTALLAMLCVVVFLATTFAPSIRALPKADFFRGFSGGFGTVALIAAIYYCVELQKEKKPGNER